MLRVLESANSTAQFKLNVLKALRQLLSRPKALIELFVGFDCALDANPLLEKVFDVLGKVAQGKFSQVEYGVLVGGRDEVGSLTMLDVFDNRKKDMTILDHFTLSMD